MSESGPSRLTLQSHAKVNLFLEVLGKRPDGYHELETVMQEVSLHDTLTFERIPGGIEIICDNPDIPRDESNLVWKAAALMMRRYPGHGGVRVTIVKRIPLGGGMGGGSSNAAVTLKALGRMWGLGLKKAELENLAAEIGSDAPFFIGGGCALCHGRGEKVTPIRLKKRYWYVLVFPGFAVSTKEVYANLQTYLTTTVRRGTLTYSVNCGTAGGEGEFVPFNRLEGPAFQLHPVLRRVRNTVAAACSDGAMLSGSGSTLFGICETRKEAEQAKIDVDGKVGVITMVVYGSSGPRSRNTT